MSQRVTDALILMAGSGSRLRAVGNNLPKPLIQIAGRAVFSYTLDALEKAGIQTVHIVIGWNGESLLHGLKPLIPSGMKLNAIHNPDWQKQNGVSVLAAANHLKSPFLMTMGDHLFDSTIVDLAIRKADANSVNLAVDRKLSAIFDIDDAMKVKTKGDLIVAIGKDLEDYDSIDTGLFVCSPEIFKYLEQSKRNEDCSLADGVRAMAQDGKVRAIDIGEAWWQDIDTPEMLAQAEKILGGARAARGTALS
jgi:1L-myo-inositol 1-phosphate cytidylyltransferase